MVIIDPEFQKIIPPQSEEERAGLEASLLAEGCRDALVVWRGKNILVDGHHRYAICQQHNIPFKTVEREFASREDVIVWIAQNQLARRNIVQFVKDRLALKIKAALAEIGKRNMAQGLSLGDKPQNTREDIAKLAETSTGGIAQTEVIEAKAPEAIKKQAETGEISRKRAYELTKALGALPVEYRDKVAALVVDNLEKAQILARLHKSLGNPDTNGTFDEIMDTGGFSYGDEMEKWCNFKEHGVEVIRKGLDSIIQYHRAEAGKNKPKTNYAGNIYEPQGHDACQTPPYAIEPLLPYLKGKGVVWESAQGKGLLIGALQDAGITAVGSDLITGDNFFEYQPDAWDITVTNPPYSIKYKWLERCYELGKPFALLVPVETLGAQQAQILLSKYGFEMMLLDNRVDFKMPKKGFEGSSAQFPVMWLCWKVLPQQVVFASIKASKKEFALVA